MSAIVTDQFRILNANNFVDSVESTSNSYYVFVGLSNPTGVGYGRTSDWSTNTPAPIDTLSNNKHTGDSIMYGKKITSANHGSGKQPESKNRITNHQQSRRNLSHHRFL